MSKITVFTITIVSIVLTAATVFALDQSDFAINEDSSEFKAANKVSRLHSSKQMQKAIEDQIRRLQSKYKGKLEGGYPGETCENHSPRILVFVSESMPDDLLISFANESFLLQDHNVAEVMFVLRGKPKMGTKHFGGLLNPEGNPMVISIDPFLYEKLEIEKVPIVIFDRQYAVKFPESIKSAVHILGESGHDYMELVDALK